jgi:hypothetical protein
MAIHQSLSMVIRGQYIFATTIHPKYIIKVVAPPSLLEGILYIC